MFYHRQTEDIEEAFRKFRDGDWAEFRRLWGYLQEQIRISAKPLITRHLKSQLDPEDVSQEMFMSMRGQFESFLRDFSDVSAVVQSVRCRVRKMIESYRKKPSYKAAVNSVSIQTERRNDISTNASSPVDRMISEENNTVKRSILRSFSDKLPDIERVLSDDSVVAEVAARRLIRTLNESRSLKDRIKKRLESADSHAGRSGSLRMIVTSHGVILTNDDKHFGIATRVEASNDTRLAAGSGIWIVDSGTSSGLPRQAAAKHGIDLDPVDCTVYAPPEVNAGGSVMIQVWVHTQPQAAEVQNKAIVLDDEAKLRGEASLATKIVRGSTLVFQLSMPGLRIDERRKTVIWEGRPSSSQFRVFVPKNHAETAVHGTVTICQEQVPLGEVTFKLRIKAGNAESKPPTPVGQSRSFDYFFVSYSSNDRVKVLEKVQMLDRLEKRYFMDVLRLKPGDHWNPTLFSKIDESDAVLLFWSSNAKKSEWVMNECRYAISTKGIERILPVVIEGPPPVEPPPELAALHLNDPLLYVIYAENEVAKQNSRNA